MASATEAEIGALFINTCKGEELCLALKEMGHPQLPTLVMTDNSTACGILNKNVKQKRTQAIDMQFYWVCNRIAQNHFVIYWCPGSENLGEYHTKHHSAAHHKCMCQYYLHQVESLAYYDMCMSPRDLQGRVESDGGQTPNGGQTLRAHNPDGRPMTLSFGFKVI
eukprot:15344048-Ditylum_brightwellii.AAC.1